jgi:hypothetical protein
MHARGEKIVMLTADVATFAAVAEAAGVECLLAGDSLGMVCRTPSACRSTRCANTESGPRAAAHARHRLADRRPALPQSESRSMRLRVFHGQGLLLGSEHFTDVHIQPLARCTVFSRMKESRFDLL